MTVKHELVTQKNESWWVKVCGGSTCSSLVVQLSCSCRSSLIFHQLPLKSLCFSVPLYKGWLWLFLIRCSKWNDSSTKWRSPSQIWRVEQQNQSFLANGTDWELSSHYLLWLFDNMSVHLSLGSTAASLEFFHSRIPLHYHSASLPAAGQNTNPEGVLC